MGHNPAMRLVQTHRKQRVWQLIDDHALVNLRPSAGYPRHAAGYPCSTDADSEASGAAASDSLIFDSTSGPASVTATVCSK